ncbi:MAG: hydantoinase/oxoprolinase family protein [Nitrospinae bacterium]|nr:hydantoinase/oxoprolinase family protein [Nitrospinota bacterium]
MATDSTVRVGVDVGGTFTDIVCLSPDGMLRTKKVPSTVDDYSRAIRAGLQALLAEMGMDGTSVSELIHGATIAGNAILEHKGAITGLITTKGFRDVLEIRRLRMPRLYDMDWEKPKPLVERYRRLEVGERINFRGDVLRALDPAEARAVIDRLLERGAESIAVCLINAYANSAHERLIARLIRERAPHVSVSISAEVQPEIKEYERTSTTVINAYVRPVVERYLGALEGSLAGIGIQAPLLIMQSNGGIMTAAAAREKPIHMIESGPVAGVMGALHLGQQIGEHNLITFDMGGTTAKASIIEHGELTRSPEYEVGGGINIGHRLLKGGGYLLRVPAIDVAEVGAGGGSIAWLDKGSALQVGPHSAGAMPGPVCYGLGGTAPTVTDANIVLGYINPEYLVGGALRLDAEKAHEAIDEKIARPLGLERVEAAHGIHVIANATMMRALRAVSIERGRDPRQFALIAFGGNGPVHGVDLARSLGVARVIVPPVPGLFSSLGLLFSEVEHHYLQSFVLKSREVEPASLEGVFGRLEGGALATLALEGYPRERVDVRRFVDVRYLGQNSELTIPLHAGTIAPRHLQQLEEDFAAEHEKTYGYRSSQEAVQIVNIRVVARGLDPVSRVPSRLVASADGGRDTALSAMPRRVYFGPQDGWIETPVIRRAELAGGRQQGALIVEEYDATTVVPPRCSAMLDEWGNIVIAME